MLSIPIEDLILGPAQMTIGEIVDRYGDAGGNVPGARA